MRKLAFRLAGAAALAVSLLLASTGQTAPKLDKVALTYFYAGAHQTWTTPTETSVAANITIQNPAVGTGDFHSIAEVAVQDTSTGTVSNAVEVGWGVNPDKYGSTDTKTRLLAYHWVNGVQGGYVTSTTLNGFIMCTTAGGCSNASSVHPGDDITADTGTVQAFSIQYLSTGPSVGWWLSYKGLWLGYFPSSLWTSPTFTAIKQVQGFGEVAANGTSPCTRMGDGVLKTASPSGSKVGPFAYGSGTAPNMSLISATNSADYNAVMAVGSTRTVYYGGKGDPSCP